MLKTQLTNRVSGIILEHIREEKGRLTRISDESRINRKWFNAAGFARLRHHQMLRIVYALCLELSPGEFNAMTCEIFNSVKDFADDFEYQLLDE